MIELRLLGPLSLQDEDGGAVLPVLAAPKRLAFLTYLALERPGEFHRRDSLLALFWPESADRQARTSLRNILFELRRALGPEAFVNRGAEEVGLAGDQLWCDARAFEEAARAGRLHEALELYRGDLLEGFHAPDVAPEFEHWLDGERARLRTLAAETACILAEEREAAGDASGAVHWIRWALALIPTDEAALQHLLRMLVLMGDRTGALHAYEEFAVRLAAEWGVTPSGETRSIVHSVRAGEPREAQPATGDASAGSGAGEVAERAQRRSRHSAPEPPPSDPRSRTAEGHPRGWAPRPSRGRRLRRWSAVATAALAAIATALFIQSRSRDPALVVAVGPIATFGVPDSASVAPAIRNLLATGLARVPGLQVVGTERLHELLALGDGSPPERGAWDRAARRAGAGVLVEGVLHTQPDGRYRLSLARRDLRTGRVEDAAVVLGADPYALLDRAAVQLLASFGVEGPPLRIGGATTRSPDAYRFYEEGLRAYNAGDNDAAHRLLSTALREDSLFAMAAYYRALTRREIDQNAFRRDLGRAARLAEGASDRERLLIGSAWAQTMDEPRQLALAETLAIRYPQEPDGHLFLGRALLWGGDFLAALPHLRQVTRIESPRSGEATVRCRACDALEDEITAYLLADSLPAAEAVVRRWVERQPSSARAWHHLARTLEYQGRYREALDARRRAADLRNGTNPRDPLYPAVLALRAGEFALADSLLGELDGSPDPLVRQNVLWYRTLLLLYQRRFDPALRSARLYRGVVLAVEPPAQRRPWESVLEAIVLHEMGRYREAAALWRAMAEYPYEPESPPRTARHRAWTLTQLASALAAAGDTAGLPALADTIEALGARSAFGRDPRLHRYVRGLHLVARGDTARAADAFRDALFSHTDGYGRINLALGRALIALGRPREAAEVLGAALRGPLDRGNLYANRTEVHALLAWALHAAGRFDSARVHESWIARARSR